MASKNSDGNAVAKEDLNLLPLQFRSDHKNDKSYEKILFKFNSMGLTNETRKNFRFVHSNANNGAPMSHELIVRDGYKFTLTTQIVCKCKNYTPHDKWFGICGRCSNFFTGKMTRTNLRTVFSNSGRPAKVNFEIGICENDLSWQPVFSKKHDEEAEGQYDYHMRHNENMMQLNASFKGLWTFDDYDAIGDENLSIVRAYFSLEGSIVIMCDITVLNPGSLDYDSEIDVNLEKDDVIKSPEQSVLLSQQFSDANINPLTPNEELGDVVLVVDKSKIYCHKFILSMSSSFFKKMFSRNIFEKDDIDVLVNDHSLDTMISLLRYLYGHEIQARELTPKLLAASDFYGLMRLKEMCTYKLLHSVDWNNVGVIWRTAYLHNLEDLSYLCIAFMAKHWHSLSEDDEMKLLVEEYPNLLLVVSKLLSENQFRIRKNEEKEGQVPKIE